MEKKQNKKQFNHLLPQTLFEAQQDFEAENNGWALAVR